MSEPNQHRHGPGQPDHAAERLFVRRTGRHGRRDERAGGTTAGTDGLLHGGCQCDALLHRRTPRSRPHRKKLRPNKINIHHVLSIDEMATLAGFIKRWNE
jgi:hypothetical protein